LAGKLLSESYGLYDGSIVGDLGLLSSVRFDAANIESWAVYPEMGADYVKILLKDGQELLLTDKHNDLIGVLKSVAGNREIGSAVDRL
jgi:hypothetical protein